MRKAFSTVFIVTVCLAIYSAMPVFAAPGQNDNGNSGAPHSTPGLEFSMLSGLATAGYIGFQFVKGAKLPSKKEN